MGKVIKLAVLFSVVIIYLIFFNTLAVIKINQKITFSDSESSGTNEIVGFADSIAISVYRDGFFYNKETKSYQDYSESKIYILNFIPLPISILGYTMVYLHILFFFIVGVLSILIILSDERGLYLE